LVSKEIYKYEFDFAGNWNRMTTSVGVVEGGKIAFEPSEVTYRSIMYYLDENMLRMAQPTTQPSSPPPAAVNASLPKTTPAETRPTTDIAVAEHKPSLPAASSNKLKNDTASPLPSVRSNAGAQPLEVKLDSDPPPPRPARSILKPVSGGVLNGTAISLPSPTYPEAARRLGTAGLVSVEVVVDEVGKVISARAVSGPNALRDVAVQAAMRARFSPTKLSGQPVKVTGSINYKFAIAQ
jgi:protein TonB